MAHKSTTYELPSNLEDFYGYFSEEIHRTIIDNVKKTFALYIPNEMIPYNARKWHNLHGQGAHKTSCDIMQLLSIMSKLVTTPLTNNMGGTRARVKYNQPQLYANGIPKVYICVETVFQEKPENIAGYRWWFFVIDETWDLNEGLSHLVNTNASPHDFSRGKKDVTQNWQLFKGIKTVGQLVSLKECVTGAADGRCVDIFHNEESNPVELMDFEEVFEPVKAFHVISAYAIDEDQANEMNYLHTSANQPSAFKGFPFIDRVLNISIVNFTPINVYYAPLPRIVKDLPLFVDFIKHKANVLSAIVTPEQFQKQLNAVSLYIAKDTRLDHNDGSENNAILRTRTTNMKVYETKVNQSIVNKDGGTELQAWRVKAAKELSSIISQNCRATDGNPQLTESVSINWSWFHDRSNKKKYPGPKKMIFLDLPITGTLIFTWLESIRTITRIYDNEKVALLLNILANSAYMYNENPTGKPCAELRGPPGCGKSVILSSVQQLNAPGSTQRRMAETAKAHTADMDGSDITNLKDENEATSNDPDSLRIAKTLMSEEAFTFRSIVHNAETGERKPINKKVRHSSNSIGASNHTRVKGTEALYDRQFLVSLQSGQKKYSTMSHLTTGTYADVSGSAEYLQILNAYKLWWEKLIEARVNPQVNDFVCHGIVTAVMNELDIIENKNVVIDGTATNLRIRTISHIKKLCRTWSMMNWLFTLFGTSLINLQEGFITDKGVYPNWDLSLLTELAYVSYIDEQSIYFVLTLYDVVNTASENVTKKVLKTIAELAEVTPNWRTMNREEAMGRIRFATKPKTGFLDTTYVQLKTCVNKVDVYDMIWNHMKLPRPLREAVLNVVESLIHMTIVAEEYVYVEPNDPPMDNDEVRPPSPAIWNKLPSVDVKAAKFESVAGRDKGWTLSVATTLLTQDFDKPKHESNLKKAILKVAQHSSSKIERLVTAYPLPRPRSANANENDNMKEETEYIHEGVEVIDLKPDPTYPLIFTNPTPLTPAQIALLRDDSVETDSTFLSFLSSAKSKIDCTPDELSQIMLSNSQGFNIDTVKQYDPLNLAKLLRKQDKGAVKEQIHNYPQDFIKALDTLHKESETEPISNHIKARNDIKKVKSDLEEILASKKRAFTDEESDHEEALYNKYRVVTY